MINTLPGFSSQLQNSLGKYIAVSTMASRSITSPQSQSTAHTIENSSAKVSAFILVHLERFTISEE